MTKLARRAVLFGGVAAAAAAAGGVWAWHRQREQVDQAADSFWGLRLARPDGGEMAMASLRGRPLLLNFWATWCAPCLKELPQIDRFHRDFKPRGWQVLGLAMDGAAPVREFLVKLPLSFPVVLGGLDGSDAAMALGNLQGVLPFTVIFDAEGHARWHKLGETHYEELAEQTKKL
jgi:thiol-disulfide isomerase/thioredoxin